LVGDGERHYLFSYLEDRFGIPENIFDDYVMFKRKQSWMIFKNGPHIRLASQLKLAKIGMRAFHRVSVFIKPTTRMIQYFGYESTKARFGINEGQLLKLLDGESIPADLDLDDGYIILDLGNRWILGLGLLINGRVRSQLPRKEIRAIMVKENPSHILNSRPRTVIGEHHDD
jgi:NOL1/NOP2/fmu family ribosome biogenesis protein